MKRKALIFGILLCISLPCLALDICTSPVMTEAGLVQGEQADDANACVWKGIPYAQPPVGELRWKAPKPPKHWKGVKKADKWPPKCMQKGIMKLLNADPSGKMSEDCLYLNIWRPKKPGKFPVMVWIHGGGFTGGTGNTPNYWGDRLAEKGEVVVVTFNYRLNVFGFFAHPKLREEDPNKSTGGYGILDQIQALRWVKNNIANFGGDPDNITIFGESAGGWSVCTLLATPLAKGLFQHAILESGGCEASTDLDTGYKQAKEIAQAVGCDFNDLNCLRKVPAKKLLKVAVKGSTAMEFYPRHDGYILTDTPLKMIQSGNFNKVPLIAGNNRNEMGIVMPFVPQLFFTLPRNYKKKLVKLGLPEEAAEKMVELYPLDEFNNKPRKAYACIFSDASLACPTYQGAKAVAEQGGEVYYYRFDYGPGWHATEIPFIFNTLDRPPATRFIKKKIRREGKELAKAMKSYWVNFARTGIPNSQGLPYWPKFNSNSPKILVFDLKIRTETADMENRCQFWKEFFKEMPLSEFVSFATTQLR